MGLLTNPNSSDGGLLLKMLKSRHLGLSSFSYILGLLGFFLMVHPHYSGKTYFSENALLPGLVDGDFSEKWSYYGGSILGDLMAEKSKGEEAYYAYVAGQFRRMGLGVHLHNFTLNYPLKTDSKGQFKGRNLYGILRGRGASSRESLVLSVPYRPISSLESPTDSSVALLVTLAKFFRAQNYWAKDIVFLMTQHEQLGIQAWLEAYHQTSSGLRGCLDSGDLPSSGRAGAIQAAINLEIHSEKIENLNLKIQGLNGQLPNLDLFNLVNRLCIRERVSCTFQGVQDHPRLDSFDGYMRSLNTMTNMLLKQASGVPSGNHGLFHRFGIEALTIESSNVGGSRSNRRKADFYNLGLVMEGIFRSLNNLLERFHQSFFFYLLPSSNRYVSIGMYMPFMGLLGGAFIISALGLWLQILDIYDDEPLNLTSYTPLFLTTHSVGLLFIYLPISATKYGAAYFNLSAEDSVSYAMILFSAFSCIVIPRIKVKNHLVVKCFTLIELATLAFSISLSNFSLAFLVTAIITPVTLIVQPRLGKLKSFIGSILCLITHPLFLLYLFCLLDAYKIPILWEGGSIIKLLTVSFNSAKRALLYSITDGYIYGNLSFNTAALFLIPPWLQLWSLNFAH